MGCQHPIVASSTHFRTQEKWMGTLVGGAVFIVYLLTLAPDITWSHWGADGADFIVAVVSRILPHPPGFPLYLIIGRLFTFIRVGTVAWRMNVLSAMMAAGAVSLAVITLREKGLSMWASIAAGLSLGFAPLFWSQAVITEVYTSAAFFVSLTYYFNTLAIKCDRSAILPGITWGMAVAIHPTTAITAIFFWTDRKQLRDGIIAGVLTVLVCYASLLFWATEPQRWAETGTINGWFAYGTGQLYWDYAFGLPKDYLPRRTISWLTLFVRQFTPIGSVLVIIGINRFWQLSKKHTLGFCLCMAIISLYAISYNSFDSFIYMVPILPLFSEILGRGMEWLVQRRMPGFILMMIPLFMLITNWQSITLHTDHTVTAWLERTLSQIPEGGIALTDADAHTFSLWYAQEVARLREDIVVLDTRLWEYQPYRSYLSQIAGASERDYKMLGQTHVICEVKDMEVECH